MEDGRRGYADVAFISPKVGVVTRWRKRQQATELPRTAPARQNTGCLLLWGGQCACTMMGS